MYINTNAINIGILCKMQWHLIQSFVYMCTEIKNKNIPFHVLPYLWLKFLAWLGHSSLNNVLHLYKTYRWMKICHNPWGKKWRNSHESFSHNEGNWKSIVCITNEVSETTLNAQVWLYCLQHFFFSDCPGFTCFRNTVLSHLISQVLILQSTPWIWGTARK